MQGVCKLIRLQHLECVCGVRFTENVVGNDEFVPIATVERIFGHFGKKGHKPKIIRWNWGTPDVDEIEVTIP